MIYLKPKNADDTVDYTVDLTSHLPDDVKITAVEVAVVEAGNSESPITLETVGSPVLSEHTSPPLGEKEFLVWLSGGTVENGNPTNYRLMFQITDDTTSPERTFTRAAQIQVRDDL